MTLLARTMALAAALAGLFAGLAGLLRAFALAADERRVWRLPDWWRDLGSGSMSWSVAVIAAVVTAAAVAYLIVGLRQLSPPQAPVTVTVGGTRVKVAALEHLLAARLRAAVPGLLPLRVGVAWTAAGWDVAVLVDAPPHDLLGTREHAAAVAGDELARAAGGRLAGLDLEVRRFITGRA